ncbi:class I adenylate-forming enzyme family protein [Nocardia sp. CA-084685]|uniref:class I adenylate-forming enzyme family protein n=1 Tax=Nocardia sp. CA-084685 TaxID=3239970 RepID=UPI003D95204A
MIILRRSAENPFPIHGVHRDGKGVAQYEGLPESLVALLRQQAESTPDAEAVVEVDGPRLSYRQLYERASQVSGGLRAEGLKAGDRVALRYPAGIRWVLAFWGTLMAGGIPVAVNTRFAIPEIAYVLDDAGVAVDLDESAPLPEGDPHVAEPQRDDVAAIFYTSGTTGRPKGVPTTHRAFLSNAETAIRCFELPRDIGAGLRTLISVPLFHVTGCNSQLLVATALGGTSVIMPNRDLARMLEVIVEERISFLVTVPAIYALLLQHPAFDTTDLRSVRHVGYGGAPITSALVRKLQYAFPDAVVFNGYGTTETASLLAVLPNADAADHADSVGYAAPVVDLAIDPVYGPYHGELLARGPNITTGYWNQPDATAATFTDGWVHTGDIVTVDQTGRVTIVDRATDMINRGGENISSLEVEQVLGSAPGVTEAAVIGVPDEVMGEKVGAILVAGADGIDIDAVISYTASRLADYKIPQYVQVMHAPLPRNPAGKLLKAQLRESVVWTDPLR